MVSDKCIVSCTGLLVLGGIQLGAWYLGHNGTVTALVTGGIGAILGSWFDLRGYLKKLTE